MIELKAFVSVFILTLLSAQNGRTSTLGSNGTFRSPQRRSSGEKQIAPYLVFMSKKIYVPSAPRPQTFLNIFGTLHDTWVSKTILCRGAIISTRFILTSADCAVQYKKWDCGKDLCSSYEPLDARDFKVEGSHKQKVNRKHLPEVKKIHIPPTFKITDNENQCLFHSDIALFELKKPLRFNGVVNKVNLPEPVYPGKVDLDETKTNRLANANEFCTIVTSTDSEKMALKGSRNFKLEKIRLIDTNKCIDYLKTINSKTPYKNNGLCTDTTVCSSDETRKERDDGGCFGRKGSPLVCGEKLVGLESWDAGDCYALGFYTRVDVHVPWIRSVLKNTTQT